MSCSVTAAAAASTGAAAVLLLAAAAAAVAAAAFAAVAKSAVWVDDSAGTVSDISVAVHTLLLSQMLQRTVTSPEGSGTVTVPYSVAAVLVSGVAVALLLLLAVVLAV
jgi:hypothetical protein